MDTERTLSQDQDQDKMVEKRILEFLDLVYPPDWINSDKGIGYYHRTPISSADRKIEIIKMNSSTEVFNMIVDEMEDLRFLVQRYHQLTNQERT